MQTSTNASVSLVFRVGFRFKGDPNPVIICLRGIVGHTFHVSAILEIWRLKNSRQTATPQFWSVNFPKFQTFVSCLSKKGWRCTTNIRSFVILIFLNFTGPVHISCNTLHMPHVCCRLHYLWSETYETISCLNCEVVKLLNSRWKSTVSAWGSPLKIPENLQLFHVL